VDKSKHNACHFSWQSLGKPDYSQCAAFVASLPAEIRCKLTKTAEEVLRRLLYLEWMYAYRSGRAKAYCWPSQTYLARCANVCRETVNRTMSVLQELGLQTSTHRGRQGENWQTNLYAPGVRFLAVLYARVRRKKPINSPCDIPVTRGPKEGTKSGQNSRSLVESSYHGSESPQGDPDIFQNVGSPEASNEAAKTGFASIVASIAHAMGKSPEEKAKEQEERQARLRKYWQVVNPQLQPF